MPRECDDEAVLARLGQLDSRAWAAYLRNVTEALANHPSLREDVCRKLEFLRQKRRKEPRADKAEELEDEDDAEGHETKEPLPANIECCKDFTYEQLRDIWLPCCAGPGISSALLRSLEPLMGGQVGLLRLFEYATGIPPEFKFTGVYRCQEALRQLFRQRAAARGDRAQKLPLPPMWGRLSGVYEFHFGYGRGGHLREVLL
jgi:hypothetical protein